MFLIRNGRRTVEAATGFQGVFFWFDNEPAIVRREGAKLRTWRSADQGRHRSWNRSREPHSQVAKRIGERSLGALGNWHANRLYARSLRFLPIAPNRANVAVFEA